MKTPEQWASKELIAALSRCFSGYDVKGTWESLFATVTVFNRLSRETSLRLQIEYPDKVEVDILEYLQYLQN